MIHRRDRRRRRSKIEMREERAESERKERAGGRESSLSRGGPHFARK
jgi:hypothetical protein